MAETGRFGRGDLVLFLIVLLVAAGARAWYLSVCASNGASDGPLLVQDPSPVLTGLPPATTMHGHSPPTELDALVHNLKEDRWFGSLAPLANAEEQTAHLAPGYPWFLFLLEQIPINLGPADQVARWLQCGLGALTAGLYFLFALRAFGSSWVAALAGLLCALHPVWIVDTAQLADGVLTTFLLAACLSLGARGGQSGGAFTSLLFGLALAGLALVRAALLPFTVVALLWFLFRSRSVPRGWLCALLAFLGFANGLASWTFRNYKVFHDLIPIADSTYLHLWIGNNPQTTGGPQTNEVVQATLSEAGDNQKADHLVQLGQNERYQQLAHEVWKQVRNNPAGTLQHRLEAAVSFCLGAQWLTDRKVWQTNPTGIRDLPPWLDSLFYGWLVFLLLAGLLGWRWTYDWRHQAMPSSLALIWIPLPYILSHAENLQGARLPLDGVLLCYAAFIVAGVIPAVGRGLFRGGWARSEG
jgi:hypothetical protein